MYLRPLCEDAKSAPLAEVCRNYKTTVGSLSDQGYESEILNHINMTKRELGP